MKIQTISLEKFQLLKNKLIYQEFGLVKNQDYYENSFYEQKEENLQEYEKNIKINLNRYLVKLAD